MTIPLYDLKVRDSKLRQDIEQAFETILDTAGYIGGEAVEKFATEFAAFCGGGTCATLANGTDALMLTLRALGIGPGDEVITVPFTFIATTEAISSVGASIKFVDIHPKNYTMDVTWLNNALTPKTKALLPVHLFGQPCDMDPLMAFAKKHKLLVIEDAAQAVGAEYKGKRVGLFGDAACFSFYPTKNLGAMGDAGAVVSATADLISKIKQLANHGRLDQYFHAKEGFNSRMDALQAAVLRLSLKKLDEWNERRRTIAAAYTNAIIKNTFITPPTIEVYAKHVFHLYCIETSHRDQLIQHLKDRGIATGINYPMPLHLQPAYAHLNLKKGSFPVSERLSERILSLPIYPTLTDENIKDVTRALQDFSPRLFVASK